MSWWRRRNDTREHDRWLAGRLLDEALYVFATMRTAADDGRLDADLRDLLRTTALDVLDDVTCLAHLAGSAPMSPPAPGVPSSGAERPPPGRGDEPPILWAVQAMGDYAERLAAVALVFACREDEASTAFVELAAAAEARIELLAA
jgi:hypothetical protein